MRTIREGDKAKGSLVGRGVSCDNCKWQGEIEHPSEVTQGCQSDPGDLVHCPNCGASITLAAPSEYFGPG